MSFADESYRTLAASVIYQAFADAAYLAPGSRKSQIFWATHYATGPVRPHRHGELDERGLCRLIRRERRALREFATSRAEYSCYWYVCLMDWGSHADVEAVYQRLRAELLAVLAGERPRRRASSLLHAYAGREARRAVA